MTTTTYDTTFLASDTAFTDNDGNVHLDVPFRKVARLDRVTVGMAGCLACMVDFLQSVMSYVTGEIAQLVFPAKILERIDRDFVALLHTDGVCLLLSKSKGDDKFELKDVTDKPTVIGSGNQYVSEGFQRHKNGVVAVLEATRHDKYTKGNVIYCSVVHEDIHNLKVDAMSKDVKLQITGMHKDIVAAEEFLGMPENEGKSFHASTYSFVLGTPKEMRLEEGLAILERGLADVRAAHKKV